MTTITCQGCGAQVHAKSRRRKWCYACGERRDRARKSHRERELKRSRRERKRKRKRATAKQLRLWKAAYDALRELGVDFD
jgi:hypothetical protein